MASIISQDVSVFILTLTWLSGVCRQNVLSEHWVAVSNSVHRPASFWNASWRVKSLICCERLWAGTERLWAGTEPQDHNPMMLDSSLDFGSRLTQVDLSLKVKSTWLSARAKTVKVKIAPDKVKSTWLFVSPKRALCGGSESGKENGRHKGPKPSTHGVWGPL